MDAEAITVIKKDTNQQETWRYTGRVLERTDTSVRLEALFNRSDRLFEGIWLREGDPFIESFYSDRWYNVFEIHDRDDGQVKGWYCNVACPAEFAPGEVAYVDLALDLLVYADGTRKVLDEDEFAELNMPPDLAARARAALDELLALPFTARAGDG